MNKNCISTLVMLSLLGLSACSSRPQVASQWNPDSVAVDGENNEWQTGMTFIEEKNLSLGFCHDADNFYMILATNDKGLQRQIMVHGLYVWFDPSGGSGHTFGIRFPVGMMEMGMMQRGAQGPPRGSEFVNKFQESLDYLEITTPGKDEPHRLTAAEAKGVKAKLGDPENGIVYELKVPLRSDETHPFAIELAGDKPTIGVGLETAQLDRDKLREQMSGGRPGGGVGIGGGNRDFGGGRGGMRGGRGPFERPEQLKLWVKVTLEPQGATTVGQPGWSTENSTDLGSHTEP